MAISKIPSKKYGFTYQVDYRYKDSLGVTQRILKSGFKSPKEAKSYLLGRKDELALQNVRECNKTFDDLFLEYMEVEGNNKYANSSKTYYFATYDYYVKNQFGKTPITGIKYVNLQKEFNRLSKKYNYPTLKNIKKLFAVTLNYAIRAGYIKENPTQHIQLPKDPLTERIKVDVINDEDLRKTIDALLNPSKHNPVGAGFDFKSKSYAMAVFIGRYTGLRVSETLALKKEDFDLVKHTMTVQRRVEYSGLSKSEIHLTGKMKSAKSKAIVEINRKLSHYLKQWFEVNPYDLVICDENGCLIPPLTFNMRIRTIAKNLDINFHYHMLRHTYATELMMAGINPIVVKELLRHSEVATTWNTYTHPQNEDQREVLDNLYQKME